MNVIFVIKCSYIISTRVRTNFGIDINTVLNVARRTQINSISGLATELHKKQYNYNKS